MRLPFAQIDAFAARPFTGNPAAVVPLGSWLPDATLQAIAAENNLSETAFTVPAASADAEYELRWFTPTTEVVLCGHATLASGHYWLTERPTLDRVRFATRRAGPLAVARAGQGYELSLPSWPPAPQPLPQVLAALGLDEAEETRWHELGYALVVVADERIVRDLAPDFRALSAIGDILTIVTAPGRHTDVISRVFAAGAGIDEDPVTGSAHGVMAAYWAERLGRNMFTAHQASARGGTLGCRLDGDGVVLTGECVTVIEGALILPD